MLARARARAHRIEKNRTRVSGREATDTRIVSYLEVDYGAAISQCVMNLAGIRLEERPEIGVIAAIQPCGKYELECARSTICFIGTSDFFSFPYLIAS